MNPGFVGHVPGEAGKDTPWLGNVMVKMRVTFAPASSAQESPLWGGGEVLVHASSAVEAEGWETFYKVMLSMVLVI